MIPEDEAGVDAELYEDAPCGFLVTEPDGTIRRANRTLLAWLGRDASEVVGRRRFDDLLPPGAKIYFETHYAPLLHMQGAVQELALELLQADGRRLPVLVNASLKRDAEGVPLHVLISLFDASERRRYERELLQERARAEERAAAATALEHVAEAVVLVDADGRIRLLNKAAERLFDTTTDEAGGRELAAIAADWEHVGARIAVGAGDADPLRPTVVPLQLPSGVRWLAVAAQRAPEGVVYTIRDVTEEHRLEHLRDDIVAVVSHELRTPLAGVYGAAETLVALDDRLDAQKRRQLIELIREQSERLTRILEQVLVTERLDRGALSAERLVFDVGESVDRCVAAARMRDPSRPIRVTAREGLMAEGDPLLFEQIIDNLLDNAVKYSPPATEVRLEVGRNSASARVTVANSGPGIPAEARSRIFDKFFRGDPSQAAGQSGIGLGLYIANELATRMRGRIGLLGTGEWTTFYVDLPGAASGGTEVEQSGAGRASAPTAGR
jgi:PAS domain S-box-containing protein